MASDLTNLEASLLNTPGNVPLATRFRALFTLKALAKQNVDAIRIISKGRPLLQDTSHHLPAQAL